MTVAPKRLGTLVVLVLLALAGAHGEERRPRRLAVLVANADGGFRPILEPAGWEIASVTTGDLIAGVKSALAAARALERGDLLLLSTCAHAASGSFVWDWPLREVDALLAPIPATRIAVLEACHSGAALEALPHADVVYAACGPEEKCGGIFITLFWEALRRPATSLSDAFAYASDETRLVAGYRELHKSSPDFWPWEGHVRPRRRVRAGLDESALHLVAPK